MKQSFKWLIAVLACVAVFVGIYGLYGVLKDRYAMGPLAGQSQTQETGEQEVSYRAPDFTVLDTEGQEVKLSDYFGKPIVLNFWATWCTYCKMEMPDFDKACRENPDIQFLMVNVTDGYQETVDSAKNYIAREGYEFPVFFDTTLEAASVYGASGLPMTVFIDQNGDLVTIGNGMLTAEDLEKGLNLLRQAS